MRVLWLTAFILLVDQITKVWIKSTMYLTQSEALIGDWFKLTFTENAGMAFGIDFGAPLLVTILSFVATLLIFVYLWYVRKSPLGYRMSLGLVLGGAVGNIIDRVFYASLWDYGTLFQGRVVDFIHVDLWRTVPDWVPFFAGEYFPLFPIWNVADMAIVGGVVSILFFQRKLQKINIPPAVVIPSAEQSSAETIAAEPAVAEASSPESPAPVAEPVPTPPVSSQPAAPLSETSPPPESPRAESPRAESPRAESPSPEPPAEEEQPESPSTKPPFLPGQWGRLDDIG